MAVIALALAGDDSSMALTAAISTDLSRLVLTAVSCRASRCSHIIWTRRKQTI